MSSSSRPALQWVKERMVAYEAGLLPDEDEALFLDLVSHNPECRELWQRFVVSLPAEEPSPEHPPLSLIQDNLDSYNSGEGLSFDLLSEHFRGCEECRENARLRGINLDRFLRERGNPQAKNKKTTLTSDKKEASSPIRRRVESDGGRIREFFSNIFSPRGLTFAWATAATVAVLFLLPSRQASLGLMRGGVIGLVTRGDQVTTIPSGPDGFYLSLERPVELPPESVATISVEDASGKTIAVREGTLDDLCRPNLIVVPMRLRKDAGERRYTLILLPEGSHELRFPFKTNLVSDPSNHRTP